MPKDKKNQSIYLHSPICNTCRNAELVENIAYFISLYGAMAA